jgi:hypothetical protein
MTRHFCDRCGKEEPPKPQRLEKQLTMYIDLGPTRRELEVCQTCYALFIEVSRRWIEDGKT